MGGWASELHSGLSAMLSLRITPVGRKFGRKRGASCRRFGIYQRLPPLGGGGWASELHSGLSAMLSLRITPVGRKFGRKRGASCRRFGIYQRLPPLGGGGWASELHSGLSAMLSLRDIRNARGRWVIMGRVRGRNTPEESASRRKMT